MGASNRGSGVHRLRGTDALLGLNQIQKQRVFFIALPVKLRRVAASWTRAIALEERYD